jgi:hypothetical protein
MDPTVKKGPSIQRAGVVVNFAHFPGLTAYRSFADGSSSIWNTPVRE